MLTKVTSDPLTNLRALTITVLVRYTERCRNLPDRVLRDALQHHDAMLAHGPFILTGSSINISALIGTLTHELMDQIQHFAIGSSPEAAVSGIAQDVTDERIFSKGPRLMQVPE